MDADTLTALRGSIAKWRAIVDGTGVNEGSANCPLCQKFNSICLGHSGPCRCFGCPVFKDTAEHGCLGSPYDAYADAESDTDEDQELMKNLAQAELTFLISLLPEGEAP
jgi:hypothetical protein